MRASLRVSLAVAGIAWAAAAASQTADELIAKNIEARGGLEKIQAIQTMRLTGTLTVGDAAMPSVLEVKRPNKTRWEFTLRSQMAVQAYDGTTAWAIAPFAGKPERRMSGGSNHWSFGDMDGTLWWITGRKGTAWRPWDSRRSADAMPGGSRSP